MKIAILVLAFLAMLLGYLMEAKEAHSEPLPDIKLYSAEKVLDRWGGKQWGYFDYIISKESNNWTVFGPHYPSGYARAKQKDGTYKTVKSSAHGLCGFLNQTWIDMGVEKTDDPYIQVEACLAYAEQRYGDLETAYKFHKKNNYW